MKIPKSLRVRLVLLSAGLEALLLIGFGVALLLILRNVQGGRIDEVLRLSGAQLNASVNIDGGTFVIPPKDVVSLRTEGVFAWVLDADGNVAATMGEAAAAALPNPLPNLEQMIDADLPLGGPVRLYHTALQEGNVKLGSVVLALPLRESWEVQLRFGISLLFLIPVILAISALGGLFLANRALAPVNKVTQMARRVSAEDLSGRLNLDLPDDEIGRLANTFDEMLSRLEQAFQREQQLTADVSHELRTPLGLLTAQLSLARSRPRKAGELLTMMAEMEVDVDRLTRIVEQTLLLSQVEQQGLTTQKPVYVDALLLGVHERFEPAALAEGVALVLDLPMAVDLVIQGDAFFLEQALGNLVQNALAHTPPGGEVTVSAIRHKQEIQIRVADTGSGIAPEHLPHLFDRYYRADSARARSTGGFGLGLAIVKSIVQAHGGQIRVESTVGQGTSLTVVLPM